MKEILSAVKEETVDVEGDLHPLSVPQQNVFDKKTDLMSMLGNDSLKYCDHSACFFPVLLHFSFYLVFFYGVVFTRKLIFKLVYFIFKRIFI